MRQSRRSPPQALPLEHMQIVQVIERLHRRLQQPLDGSLAETSRGPRTKMMLLPDAFLRRISARTSGTVPKTMMRKLGVSSALRGFSMGQRASALSVTSLVICKSAGEEERAYPAPSVVCLRCRLQDCYCCRLLRQVSRTRYPRWCELVRSSR